MDQLATRRLTNVTVTKRGRAVAVLTPPPLSEASLANLHGFLRGTVVVPDGVDLTAPVLVEGLSAETGQLHA